MWYHVNYQLQLQDKFMEMMLNWINLLLLDLAEYTEALKKPEKVDLK